MNKPTINSIKDVLHNYDHFINITIFVALVNPMRWYHTIAYIECSSKFCVYHVYHVLYSLKFYGKWYLSSQAQDSEREGYSFCLDPQMHTYIRVCVCI